MGVTTINPCPASPSGSECAEGSNPRHAGRCFRCDMALPAKPGPRLRDLDLEREITCEATRGICDPSPLIDYAEARAGMLREYGDTLHVRPGRDLLQEARAELADGRNYLVWWLQEHVDHEQADDALIALRFLALAYDRLLQDD